jgi:bacillithiol system protein YtxJ
MAAIQRIESIPQLDVILERSKERPVWIFKHSLTCPISSRAWAEFQSFAAGCPEGDGVYVLIEVQNARPLSNAVAERTGIRHQSPQAILLRNTVVAWHASHYSIEVAALVRAFGEPPG